MYGKSPLSLPDGYGAATDVVTLSDIKAQAYRGGAPSATPMRGQAAGAETLNTAEYGGWLSNIQEKWSDKADAKAEAKDATQAYEAAMTAAGRATALAAQQGYRNVGPGQDNYSFRQFSDGRVQIIGGPRNVGQTYAANSSQAQAVAVEFGPFPTSAAGAPGQSGQSGQSGQWWTNFMTGVGAGVSQFQASNQATDPAAGAGAGTASATSSDDKTMLWVAGGVGVFALVGLMGFYLSKKGS
jgi:hypothetical protein